MENRDRTEKIRKQLGLIHLYCGDGKGKTTAAAGLAVRAKGSGLTVLFVQFLKSGTSAELGPLKELGIEVVSGQPTGKFVFQMDEDEREESRQFNRARFQEAVIKSWEGIDLLIFDEILGAIATGILDEEDLLEFLRAKPEHLEVVLTGRDPSNDLIKAADYVSEIMMRKHPYETSKQPARPGIEY